MQPREPNSLVCPFCEGSVNRVTETRRPTRLAERIGQVLAAELVFWFFVASAVAISFWSFLAGVLLLILIVSVWFRWEPRRAAYRCNACQTVLTYAEVKHAHKPAV